MTATAREALAVRCEGCNAILGRNDPDRPDWLCAKCADEDQAARERHEEQLRAADDDSLINPRSGGWR